MMTLPEYYNLIDPRKLKSDDMPMVVFSSDNRGLISFLIRLRAGQYNHAMFLTPDGFATQCMTFQRVPVQSYLKTGIKLKIFKIKNITPDEKEHLCAIINDRLKLPWWRRRYDFLGIIGQAIEIRFIQNPSTKYCSEQVADDLTKTISKMPLRPTPEELEEFIKDHPRFEYVGHWIGD